MTRRAIAGARVLSGGVWHDEHVLVIDGTLIHSIERTRAVAAGVELCELDGGYLLPGFIDVQVNGGGGALFNDAPTLDTVRTIAAAHRRFGTTGMMPTLITANLDTVREALAAVDAAISADVPGVLGVHVEGPFLNTRKAGIHDRSKMRALDDAAIELLGSARLGRTLVTLAPELARRELLQRLLDRGVILCAGHSLATYEQAVDAFAIGVSGVTHLFNAMTQFESRQPGLVGAALLQPSCFCGLIVDGHHVHPAAMKLALQMRGTGGVMLVTDAMPTVGSTSKSFVLDGQVIEANDGACRSPDGTLAGSDLDMSAAVRNAITMMGVDLAGASRMASGSPAVFLGQADMRGDLRPGLAADLVHLDDALHVTSTWIAGVRECHR